MLAIYREKKVLVDILIIFCFSLICLVWFKDGFLINNVDLSWPVEYDRNLIERFSVWQEQRGGGGGFGTIIPGAPYAFLIYISSLFNFGFIGTQKIVFVLTNFILGLSIYFSLKILWGKNKSSIRIPSLMASFYGMYNLYFSFVLVRLQQNVLSLSWILLSTAIFFSIFKNFHSKKNSFRSTNILRWIIVSGLFGWTNGIQPPIFYISMISLFLYVIIFWLYSRQSYKPYILLYIKLIIYFSIVNLWWIIPMFYYSLVNKLFDSATLNERYSTKYFAQVVSEKTSPNMVSKGLGDFSWFEGYWPDVDPLLRSSFWQIALSAMTIMIFVLMYNAVKNNVKSLEMYLIFVTYIVTLILSIGYHSPFNYLFGTLFDYLPGFNMQRAPWQKFTMFVISSQILLLPIVYIFVIGKSKNTLKTSKNRNLLASVILLLIIFPLTILTFQGKMYSFGSGSRGWHEVNGFGYHLKYPKYIIDASNYINSQHKMNNVLLLPDSDSNAYKWGYGGPADITWWLLDSGVLYPNYGAGLLSVDFEGQKLNNLYSEIQKQNNRGLICAMNDSDVTAILVRNDFNYSFLGNSKLSKDIPIDMRYEYFKEIMRYKSDIFNKKSFEEWELYELKNEYRSQNIYLDSYAQKNINCIDNIGKPKPSFKYNLQKISPSIRILQVLESKSMEKSIDRLVLNEVYDKIWIGFSLEETKSFGWHNLGNSGFKQQWAFLIELTSNFMLNKKELIKLDRESLVFNEKLDSKNVFVIDQNSKKNMFVLIYWPSFIVQILAISTLVVIFCTIIGSIMLKVKNRDGG